MSIADTIRLIIKEWQVDAENINNGNCDKFAREVVNATQNTRAVWDIDVDKKQKEFHKHHCFIEYTNKGNITYHDSECPDGIRDWYDLPYFVRIRQQRQTPS